MTGYSVEKINRNDCADLILNIHYAKRWPSISYAFGLFEHGKLVGCVTYGTPSSAPLRKGICGDDFAQYVIELNRLVLVNNKRNEASMLIAKSLKLLPKPKIVVSFADTEHNHVGTVYQAANFIYSGLSAKRTNWKVRGMEHLHGQTIADEFRGVENRAQAMRQKYGDSFYLEPRSRKHRYLYFCGTKAFTKKALETLKYPVCPYPSMECLP